MKRHFGAGACSRSRWPRGVETGCTSLCGSPRRTPKVIRPRMTPERINTAKLQPNVNGPPPLATTVRGWERLVVTHYKNAHPFGAKVADQPSPRRSITVLQRDYFHVRLSDLAGLSRRLFATTGLICKLNLVRHVRTEAKVKRISPKRMMQGLLSHAR